MYKILTAIALSTTMALSPASAQADSNDNEKALAAFLIGSAAIIALSQANKNKNKDTAKSSHKQPDVYRHTHNGSTHWHHKDEGRHSHHNRDRDDRWKRDAKTLPQRCVRSTEIGRSDFYYVESRCLKRADYDRSLPRSCSVSRGRDGQPSAYGVRCLKREGYRFDNYRFEARR